jgi:pimeloyl-ACP methyl ester carboxylesterase
VQTRHRMYIGVIITELLAMVFCLKVAAQDQPTERDISFRNDSVELHGTLMLPITREPAPAVVFLHGSGPMTRDGFRPYAREFAKLGIASLFFDKRGSGKSNGSWSTSSLNDLAEDALAAVRYLKADNEIDRTRIGFWGISQAGWVAPIAASQSEDVAFMILISGGGASPRQSELFSYRKEFERAGLSKSEESEALKILEFYFDYLSTGEGRHHLITELDSLKESTLKPLAEQLERIVPSEENRPNWSWVGAYHPIADIERIHCPVLLLFGDRDADHPTELAVKRWREGLEKADNHDVTIVVFKGAGHGIRMREGYAGGGRAPFADGYEELQLGWLWQHVVDRN